MSGMSFALNDEQRLLRDSCARFMQREYRLEQRSDALNNSARAQAVWQQMIDQGFFHLALSEPLGGLADEGSVENLSILGEELGAALMAQPVVRGGLFVASFASALTEARLGNEAETSAAQAAVDALLSARGPVYLCPLLAANSQHSTWCEAAIGEFTQALARQTSITDESRTVESRAAASKKSEGIDLFLRQLPALWGSTSSEAETEQHETVKSSTGESGVLLLLLPEGEHCSLTMIPLDDPRLSLQHYRLLDDSWAMDVHAESLALSADYRVNSSLLTEALQRAEALSGIVECAAALGTMSKMVDDSRDYLLLRRQFGKPLAEFQVLQHRLADMAVAREMARAQLHRGIACSRRPAADFLQAERACRVQCAKSAVLIGRSAIQLHGAIGLTEEHHIAHYYRSLLVFVQANRGLQGAQAECREALLNRAGLLNRAALGNRSAASPEPTPSPSPQT